MISSFVIKGQHKHASRVAQFSIHTDGARCRWLGQHVIKGLVGCAVNECATRNGSTFAQEDSAAIQHSVDACAGESALRVIIAQAVAIGKM